MEPPGAEIHGLVLVGYPRWVALRAGITSLRHIGAESSHSNKVVIRRLSYLDLLLIGRFLLLMPKEIVADSKKGNQRDWRRWPNQSELKIKV